MHSGGIQVDRCLLPLTNIILRCGEVDSNPSDFGPACPSGLPLVLRMSAGCVSLPGCLRVRGVIYGRKLLMAWVLWESL